MKGRHRQEKRSGRRSRDGKAIREERASATRTREKGGTKAPAPRPDARRKEAEQPDVRQTISSWKSEGSAASAAAVHDSMKTGRRRRAGRIARTGVAIVLLAGSALGFANWNAANRYQQTASTLRSDISSARSSAPDVDRLRINQRQVRAQLSDQARSGWYKTGDLRRTITGARAVSDRLDTVLADMATGRTWNQALIETGAGTHPAAGTSSPSKKTGTGRSSSASNPRKGAGKSPSTSQEGTSSDEKRQELRRQQQEQARLRQDKLNQLLKQNKGSKDAPAGNETTKPW